MTTQVVTVCNRIPGESEPYYHYGTYVASLERLGAAPTILGMGEWWGGLMSKPFQLRDWLRAGRNSAERLIVCDAFDIVFAEHPEAVGERCASLWGDSIVFNAEKGLFPRGDLAESFPETGTPWRYLNSGFMCGPAARILELLESMDLESVGYDRQNADGSWFHPNDQGEYQAAFARERIGPIGPIGPILTALDSGCVVSQCFSAYEDSEFEITDSGVRNLVTGTNPGVLHFNGDSKDRLLPVLMERMGLP